MEKIGNDTLSILYEESCRLIPKNFDIFCSFVAKVRELAQTGKYDEAAMYGEIAAIHAYSKHSGLFASPELEHLLLMIGRKAIKGNLNSAKSGTFPAKVRNVLHVTTCAKSIGGHSRMIWRWIQQDTERTHSVVLTRQGLAEVPKLLTDAVFNSHGRVYTLDEGVGGLVSRAKRLRQIATDADIVVLHVLVDDVIPVIAFANKDQLPPIIFVNSCDEVFWVGVSISDVVVNLRESAVRLSQKRRGIEAERNLLLPTTLSPIHRVLSRAEAKRQIGIPENSILLLSIARAPKYKTMNGVSFADMHVPLLKQYEQAILVVIGPSDNEDWSASVQQMQGRIRVFGEREDTAVFYQAADIYVDSFPVPSITSLLEAGSYGVPLVSCYPYSDACEVLGADMPGLTGNLIRVGNLEEYTIALSRLVEQEEFRLSLGEATRGKIVDIHTGSNWLSLLENVYLRASSVSQSTPIAEQKDKMFLGEPDVFIPHLHRWNFQIDNLILSRARVLPLDQRLRLWIKQIKMHGSGHFGRISTLLPEWLYLRLEKKYSRLRKNFFE